MPSNAGCRSCDYGFAAFDIPHRFVSSVLYTLPCGKGRRFVNRSGIVNQVIGGWRFTMIGTMLSGSTTETAAWDSAGIVFSPNGNRTNCIAGANSVYDDPTAGA